MDRRRRQLLITLASTPALGSGMVRAAEALVPATAIDLTAGPATDGAHPRLRYDAASSGPILRLKRGMPVRIALANHLATATSLDLQGIRVAPPLGGAAPVGGTVAPSGTAEIAFVPPDSGTFWFHPWVTDPRQDGTGQGLAGTILVDEAMPPEVDRDIVAMLADRWPVVAGTGEQTATGALTIDGADWPRVERLRPGSRIRLRLVNASTRTAVSVRCAGAKPWVVAIDGQPSELFSPRGDSLPIGPGARFDLMFDLPRLPDAKVTFAVGIPDGGTSPGAPFDAALVFEASGDPLNGRGDIVALPPNPSLPTRIALEKSTRAALTASLDASTGTGGPATWSLNGAKGFDLPKKPLLRVRRGSAVTLTFKNASPQLVAFRVHGACLRLLHDLDDGWEPYWRESVLVPPGTTHHAAFVADLPGRWLIESPFFDQAAGGLRTWFQVD